MYVDNCAKLFQSVVFRGWFSHYSGRRPNISSVHVRGRGVLACTWKQKDMPHLGSHAAGLDIQLLLSENVFPEDMEILIDFSDLGIARISWTEIHERAQVDIKLIRQFRDLLRQNNSKRMLDIGGRARSGVLRSNDYPELSTEVLDIHPGDGVTVVCDAHCMSRVLEPDSFDAVLSVSVFEHLVMPWQVAIEMNRVMKMGAIGYIQTHQSIGLHDMPWDFFRFSDSAWKGIFNAHTGFEVIGSFMGSPNFIIPFIWEPRYFEVEKSAGFEDSAVLVRKIGKAQVDWKLAAEQVTTDSYPPGTEYKPDNYRKV